MSIVLIGPQGCGKSTTGKILAQRLKCPFVDGDQALTERLGMSVKEFTSGGNWAGFREREAILIADLASDYADKRVVFAPGGGAVCHNQGEFYRKGNVMNLSRFDKIFYLIPSEDLKESESILVPRVEKDSTSVESRPKLFCTYEELVRREPFYMGASRGNRIITGVWNPQEVAEHLLVKYL